MMSAKEPEIAVNVQTSRREGVECCHIASVVLRMVLGEIQPACLLLLHSCGSPEMCWVILFGLQLYEEYVM